jgi:hypothetical protein
MEDLMRTRAGLWIDHKKTIVVAVTDKGEEICHIISKVESQPERAGDSPLKGRHESQRAPADDIRQRVLTEHLNIYYKAVIACLQDAEPILIFGPGEAKGELKKRLEKCNMGERIAAVEAADKMTDRQISAKVRQHFAEPNSVSEPKRSRLPVGSGQLRHRVSLVDRRRPKAS